MRFEGSLTRHGKWWLVEVPIFDAVTQGRSRRDALEMITDWFITMVDQKGFTVKVHSGGKAQIQVSSKDARAMISLLLRRQRQKSGLTLGQVAQQLDAKSRNAYARYEQGVSVPSVEKLDELLRAIAPDQDLVLRQSAA